MSKNIMKMLKNTMMNIMKEIVIILRNIINKLSRVFIVKKKWNQVVTINILKIRLAKCRGHKEKVISINKMLSKRNPSTKALSPNGWQD